MPNAGPRPPKKAVDTFIRYLKGKSTVRRVDEFDAEIVLIQKVNGTNIRVKLIDIYTVSESDVQEIHSEDTLIDCIVTTSAWNQYTRSAKALARSLNVGLFTFTEFMGAVYFDGKDFLDYRPKATEPSGRVGS